MWWKCEKDLLGKAHNHVPKHNAWGHIHTPARPHAHPHAHRAFIPRAHRSALPYVRVLPGPVRRGDRASPDSLGQYPPPPVPCWNPESGGRLLCTLDFLPEPDGLKYVQLSLLPASTCDWGKGNTVRIPASCPLLGQLFGLGRTSGS